jgi:hypothetical protein
MFEWHIADLGIEKPVLGSSLGSVITPQARDIIRRFQSYSVSATPPTFKSIVTSNHPKIVIPGD